MKNYTTNDLRGMIAEGCQGHAEAIAALDEMCRRADAAAVLLGVLRMTIANTERNGIHDGVTRGVYDAAVAAVAQAETVG